MNRRRALLWLALQCPLLAAAHPDPLCAPAEHTYFSCQIQGKRVVSLCGDLPAHLQYRFGRTARIELAYPRDAQEGSQLLRQAHYARFQTERVELSFQNEGVNYALFDYLEAGRRTAGVRVTTTDGMERELACSGPITGRLGPLVQQLPCDADNALNEGACH